MWSAVTRNIELLRKQERTHVTAIATLQAYNVLNIVELFRYLDFISVDSMPIPSVILRISARWCCPPPQGGWPLSAYGHTRLETVCRRIVNWSLALPGDWRRRATRN